MIELKTMLHAMMPTGIGQIRWRATKKPTMVPNQTPPLRSQVCMVTVPDTTPGLRAASRCRELLPWWSYADVAQLVEHNLAKVGVAGSNPVVRSTERPL